MNIDYYLLAVASTGFIIGWISGRTNYKKTIIHFIESSVFTISCNSRLYAKGALFGNKALKEAVVEAIKANHLNGKLEQEAKVTIEQLQKNNKD